MRTHPDLGRRCRPGVTVAIAVLAAASFACGDDGEGGDAAAADDGPGEDAVADLPSPDEWEPEWEDGTLQPLPNGWPDDELVFAVRGDPGSRNDIFMRNIVSAIENNGLSPVPLVVEEEPHDAHSSWGALRALNERAPDGSVLTVVSMAGSISSYMVEDIPEVDGVDFDAWQIPARMEAQPYVVIQRHDAPWGEGWEEMIEYAKENPGEVRYTVNSHGGGLDLSLNSILLELGIDIEAGDMEKIIAGGHQEAATNVGSGEADFTISMIDIGQQHYEAGQVVPIMTTGSEVMAPFDELDHMVAVTDLGVENYWNTDLALAVAQDTPELHQWWLYELLREAAEQDEYQERYDTVPGVEIEVFDPARSAEHSEFLYELTDAVTRNLGLHHEVAEG